MTEALSPISAAIAELLAAPAVSAITTRIRAHEPAASDSLGAGSYLPFIVVSLGDAPPRPYMPVRDATLYVRAYGVTAAQAETLGLACEAVFANAGARKAASGLGVWHSTIVSSGIDKDPATLQFLWSLVVRYPTTILAIP